MESLIANILTPENIKFVLLFVVGKFSADFIAGLFRAVAKRLLSDKNPKNDVVGDALNVAADSIEKVRIPSVK